ncbi:preprotein translocase subunit SecE [Oleiphilus messinensis]|uniref:Protein translocase subunit SecE n=1 Tax=Oleiphilus messinensis TaxID=141451 RepID=A0A1Y0I5F6_9GAMM|nr:preprotein translocase subunit SecE [Oleiphilus messinensis]ARU54765.1 preprotein translocase subunit SecE [Oleiphilus messinensis]
MSSQTDSSGGALDFLKWLAVLALVVAGVVGNYYYSSFDQSLLYRVLALLLLSVVAVAIALTTVKGKQFSGLMKESRLEIRKVVWPTRQELVQTTMIVVVFVLVVALMLWGLDSLVSWLVSGVIG